MKYLFYQSNHWLFSGFWLKESLNIKETRLSEMEYQNYNLLKLALNCLNLPGDFEPIVGNGPDKTSLENFLYCFESFQIS